MFTLMHGSLMKNTLISPNTVKFCFFDGSSADREVVVIPYNDSDLIVLKKGDIKACHYDTKSNLVNLDLSNLCLEEVGYQKVTFELNSQSRSLSNELRSEVYLFLDFCINNLNDVKLKPMKHINDFCNQMMRYQIALVRMSGGGIPASIRNNGSFKGRVKKGFKTLSFHLNGMCRGQIHF